MACQLTLEQIRLVDRVAIEQFGISGLVLMENAGRGAADVIASHLAKGDRCLVLCGTGNNGGDGFVIARHLHAGGFSVSVLVSGSREKLTHDCAVNLSILEKTKVPVHWCDDELDESGTVPRLSEQYYRGFEQSDCLVDALLGTGAKGTPRGSSALLIEAANAVKARKFAIDIPSGLDSVSGTLNHPTFMADVTLTFVVGKPAFEKSEALRALGTVLVLPIGIPPEVIEIVTSEAY